MISAGASGVLALVGGDISNAPGPARRVESGSDIFDTGKKTRREPGHARYR
jgi:hypothetical protein